MILTLTRVKFAFTYNKLNAADKFVDLALLNIKYEIIITMIIIKDENKVKINYVLHTVTKFTV